MDNIPVLTNDVVTDIKRENTELSKTFEWVDQKGNSHPVDKMETSHLFYTLRMIWNHSMPNDAKLNPYKRYTFDSFYSPQYMLQAVAAIIPELVNRDDINFMHQFEIDKMIKYLHANPIKRKDLLEWCNG